MVLRRASVPLQMLPPAINYGWENAEGQLIPIMTNNLPAQMALLEMSTCSCKSDCTSNRCKCRKNSFVCTDMCKCLKCSNDDQDEDTLEDFHIMESDDDDEH